MTSLLLPAVLALSLGAAQSSQQTAQPGRVEGVVRTKAGTGVPGIRVRFQPLQGSPRGSEVRTAADGSFAFNDLTPGHARVLASTEDPGDGGNSVELQDVNVLPGQTLHVVLTRSRIVVSGRITRSGHPGAGLRVEIMSHERGRFSSNSGLTGEDGRYTVALTAPGTARVMVETIEGRTRFPVRNLVIPDVDSHTIDLDLQGVAGSGLVVDNDTGEPIPGTRVTLSSRELNATTDAVSGPDGRFRFEMEPGDYDVSTSLSGYHNAKASVTLGSAGTPPLRLALSRNLTISGTLTDSSGRGVGGLAVVAHGPQSAGQAVTRGDGSFLIDGLAAQPHTLTAFSDTGSFAAQSRVAAGATDIALRLQPGGRVRLRVTGPGGAPLAGARAAVSKVDGKRFAAWQGAKLTDAEGKVELATPAGMVEIDVRNGAIDGQTMVPVPPGQSADASLSVLRRIP